MSGEGSQLWSEARRVFWEAYWRLLGRYRRGRPFFEVYEVTDGGARVLEDREKWILENIVVSAIANGIVPSQFSYKLYRRIYGPLVSR